MRRNDDELPIATRKLLQLIENKFNGNVSDFSRSIGKSQQVINRVFNIDKRSGKYPTLSDGIIQAVCESLGINRSFFYDDDEANDILSRIKRLIELSGLSYTDFAKKVRIEPSDFEKKLEGTMEVSDDDLIKISEVLNVRISWLYNGTGQAFKAPEVMRKQAVIDSYRSKATGEEIKGIPLIPTNAMAGSLTGDSVQIMPYDIESYFVVPAFAKSDFCIRVDGKSMEPTYCKGDIIACKYVPMTDIWFQWGKVYVIATDQGVLVKHVNKGSDGEHVKLTSDNPEYQPFEIPTSGIYNVAVINGLIRVGDI